MNAPRPTLDTLLNNPASASALSREALAELLGECAAAQSVLTAALIASPYSANGAGVPVDAEPDEWIEAEQAARLLKKKTRWIYRHRSLPFVRRAGGRLLCSRRKLEAWLERQKP